MDTEGGAVWATTVAKVFGRWELFITVMCCNNFPRIRVVPRAAIKMAKLLDAGGVILLEVVSACVTV